MTELNSSVDHALIFMTHLDGKFDERHKVKVKCDHRSKYSNLSNWKEEA